MKSKVIYWILGLLAAGLVTAAVIISIQGYQTVRGRLSESSPGISETASVPASETGTKTQASQTSPATEPKTVSAEKFNDFTLTDLNGNSVTLTDLAGKKAVINFWATWCPPCKAELPDFQKLYDELKDNPDVAILMVDLTDNQRETKETVQNFLAANHYNLPVYLDDGCKLSTSMKVSGIPMTFVLDRSGNVAWKTIGATNYNAVKTALDAVA